MPLMRITHQLQLKYMYPLSPPHDTCLYQLNAESHANDMQYPFWNNITWAIVFLKIKHRYIVSYLDVSFTQIRLLFH